MNARYAADEEKKTREWVKDHQGLAMAGAWVTDRLGLAETLDSELYYAQYGQLPYTSLVTPGRFSEIVKDTIHDDVLTDDPVSQWLYGALDFSGDAAYQAYLTKLNGGVFGSAVGAVESGSDAYNAALYEARLQGMTDEEAVAYARSVSRGKLAGSLMGDYLGNKLPETSGVKESVIKESLSAVAGSTMGNGLSVTAKYKVLVGKHMKAGLTEEETKYAAKHQILQEFGEEVFADLIGGLAYGLGYGISR